jgi:transcriptional regulator of nitric oxide reductase
VRVELALLQATWKEFIKDDEVIRDLHSQLKEVNEALWEIEDDIRDKERAKEFDERFIELARAVYVTNDRRSRVKKELTLHLGSEIVEEKSYQDYE